MNKIKNYDQIYLIGYRASGKTAVGKTLAKILNREFIDTDEEIIEQNRMEISDIVKKYGWDIFRKKEKALINSINPSDKIIIALGGGAIIDSDNIKTAKQNGTIIYLKTSPDIIKKRLAKDIKTEKNRPSLSNAGTVNEVDKILAERTPIYNKASDLIINTDNKTIKQICYEINKCLYPQQNRN
ncbi:MAG: shikimate kinase [Deltaproteobacteria bacterium]|nr:shikimate kinase [Deltaproteobacteria bacterium]